MTLAITGPHFVAEADRPVVAAALAARERAYCPYSHYAVGAALRATNGHLYLGCNVENASYGLTNCAERVALQSALAQGAREFALLAVVASGAVTPCGACRQALAEFCPELRILLVDPDQPHQARETTVAALLPCRFGLEPR